jgi:hypothetical protein
MPGVSYFAYAGAHYGVFVGAGDADGDGIEEILSMPGPDPEFPPLLRAWNADGGAVTPVGSIDFDPFQELDLTRGGRVDGGRLF